MDLEQQLVDTLENARANKSYTCTSEDDNQYEVKILTAKVRHVPKVTRLLKRFMELRGILTVSEAVVAAGEVDSEGLNIQAVMDALDEDLLNDVAEALVSLTTLTSEDQVLDMEVDDLIKLSVAVFEVNKSFFMKRLNLLANANQ